MSILYTKPGSIIMAEKHGIYRIGHRVSFLGDVSRCQANLWWRHVADQPMTDHHSLWVFAWKWWDVVGTLFGGWFHRIYSDLWVIYIYICHMSFCCKHHFGMIRKSSEQLISEYDLGKMLPQFMVLTTEGSAVLAHPQVYIYTHTMHMWLYRLYIHMYHVHTNTHLLFTKTWSFTDVLSNLCLSPF